MSQAKKTDNEETKEDLSSSRLERLDNRIQVNVIQGRNLPAADANGNSDPYVKVTFVSKSNPKRPLEQSRTRVIRKNRNPVWNDAIICEGVGVLKDCKAIILDVWDYDRATSDDFLGTVTISGIENLHGTGFPVWLQLKDSKGKDAGEIQVQVSITEDFNTLSIRDWTHVLEITVARGVGLDKIPWFVQKSIKPYVRVEWGSQVFVTSKLANTKTCQWNEKAYLFVHEKQNEKYFLQLTVMEDSVKDKTFAQGTFSARNIFANKEGQVFEKSLSLTKTQIELDKTLSLRNLEEQENAESEFGLLLISGQLHSRAKVQERYYEAIVNYYDENKNGQLEKSEVQKLLLSLDIPEDPEVFFRKYDEDANDVWSKEEIVNMLKDYDFQRSPWLSLALEKFLKYSDKEDKKTSSPFRAGLVNAHLMTGVTEAPQIGDNRQIIKIKDRRTGLVIQENIPGYVWQALQLMYNSSSGRVFAKQISSILTKMSRDKGKEYDTVESAQEIPHFIELHNLDMTVMLKKNVEDYKTFNDFFARPIDPRARPLASPDDENVIVSPADCRMVLFSNIVDSSIWVKGSNWTVQHLLQQRYEAVGKLLEGGSFVIARLAPQDYHRFHWPVSGKVVKITPIDGALYTVNPIAINQPINVYTENKRCIVEIDTGDDRFGIVVLIAVGATMVGSYALFQKDEVPLEEGAEVRRGDVSGEFRFGGSTVLVLFQKNKVRFDDDLVAQSKEKLEMLIQVNDRIGEKISRS